eukprot:COSAG04_NODE_7749_length_1073_cov_1.326489_1_plen_65_part_10
MPMLPVVPPEAGPDTTCTDPELPDADVPVAIDIAPLSPLPAGDAVPTDTPPLDASEPLPLITSID